MENQHRQLQEELKINRFINFSATTPKESIDLLYFFCGINIKFIFCFNYTKFVNA